MFAGAAAAQDSEELVINLSGEVASNCERIPEGSANYTVDMLETDNQGFLAIAYSCNSPYTVTLPDDAFLIQIKISRAELVNAQITFEQVLNVLGVDERGDALQDTDFLEELGAKIGIPAGETWAEYKTATPPEEVVLAPPAAPSSLLTQVPDEKESFQETAEKGSSLEGGGIAGIVIGVLIGLVALGVGWVYKRSQQKRIPMKEYLKNSLSTSRTTSRVELNEGSTNDIEKIKAKYRKKQDSDDSPAAVMPTGQERQTLSEKV